MAKNVRIPAWRKTCHPYGRATMVYDEEQTVINGKVLKKAVVVEDRPRERYRDMKVSDFALENIIAAGAVDMLKECVLHDATIDSVDMIDGTLNEIMDQIDAQIEVESKNNDVE